MMPIISCPDMERTRMGNKAHIFIPFPRTPFNILHVVIAAIVISASTVLVIRFARRKPDALAQENVGASSVATQDTGGQTLEEVAAKTGTTDQIAAKADGDNPGAGSLGMEG
jgi:hypothetical protein